MTQPSDAAPRRGLLIAFEGGEGCGKSTQVPLLAEWLRKQGHKVRTTFEPGDGVLGQAIRAIVLDPGNTELADRAEALLYAADRAQHVATVIAPALAAGQIVITDRYVDSSLAYQSAGRGQPFDEVAYISAWATDRLVPDLTVVLDLPIEIGLARARGRAAVDRLEAESHDFHDRVRRAFLTLAAAEPARYIVLDATAAPEIIAAHVVDGVSGLLASREGGSIAASASEPSREGGSIERAPAREERTDRAAEQTRRSDRADRPVSAASEALKT